MSSSSSNNNNNNKNKDSNETDVILKLFNSLKIPTTHTTVGLSNLIACNNAYKQLFINRRLPNDGWSDIQIQNFIFLLSTLDTNNKFNVSSSSAQSDDDTSTDNIRWCGVGEREGRVYSSLVNQRHYGLSHGMGRSGDITEPQPKAVGSSVLVKITLLLLLDALRRGVGLNGTSKDKNGPASFGVLLPMCTGMSMSLVLSSIRSTLSEEDFDKKNIVLWCRIDQKSCFKAITSSGLQCIVIPTKLASGNNENNDTNGDDSVVTDIDALEEKLKEFEGRVLAVITTTSCFAPRVPDPIDKIAKLLADPTKSYCNGTVSHIVNNAYGLQCPVITKLLNRSCVIGKVDAIVCSTDKNFLVPVGGAIVISPQEQVIQQIGKIYAGRASSSPILDLFITLLSMGLNGYKSILKQRVDMLDTFKDKLKEIATKYNEKFLICPSNTISYGITLDTLASRPKKDDEDDQDYYKEIDKDISYFGSMLFKRCVSGTRVIPRGQTKIMGSSDFEGFGSSTNNFPYAYMTAACSIGLSSGEMNEFFSRLDKSLKEYKNKQSKKTKTKE